MIWIKNKLIPFKGFNAITIWPFVFFKKDGEIMRNHEKIHGAQQVEVMILSALSVVGYSLLHGFEWSNLLCLGSYYNIYIIEWLILLVIEGKETAYHSIRFEQEAYENQYDKDYLTNRVVFKWFFYL